MRALLPNRHTMLGLLTLSVSFSLLSACTSDHRFEPEPPELNTFNVYSSTQSDSLNYYSIESDALITYKIADIATPAEGFESAISLDTDPEMQGYEYAAYISKTATQSSIYLFNYDKAQRGKTWRLTSTKTPLCGLKSIDKPSATAFENRYPGTNGITHKPEIIIASAATEACDNKIFYEKLDFSNLLDDDPDNDSDFEFELVTNSEANSTLLTDFFSSSVNFVDDGQWQGDYGNLSFNKDTQELSLSYTRINSQDNEVEGRWTTQLASNEEFTFKQVSLSQALMQRGLDLYIINISTLIDLDKQNNSTQTPTQARIDALLDSPTMTLISQPTSKISSNPNLLDSTFVINIDNTMYRYSDGSFSTTPNNSVVDDDVTLDFEVNGDGEMLLVRSSDTSIDTLSVVSANGDEASLLEADAIEILPFNGNFYFNTLNREAGSSWQAHRLTRFGEDYRFDTYENSRLLSIPDMRNEAPLLVLLSNEPVESLSGTRTTTGNYLYQFNENAENGRASAVSTRTNSEGRHEYRAVDFSYGAFNNLSQLSLIEGRVINDEYASLQFSAVQNDGGINKNVIATLVFSPNQETPDPDLNKQSLKTLEIVDVD